MGRIRTEPKGPRTIDIDIVFFGNDVLDTPELTIPIPPCNSAVLCWSHWPRLRRT